MIRRQPRPTRTDTLFPYPPLFRSFSIVGRSIRAVCTDMLQIISGPATLHPADAFLAVDDGAAAALVEAAIRYGLQRVATEHVGLDTGRSAGFVDDLGGVAGLPILIVIDDIDRDGLDARCLAVLVDIAADVRSEEHTSELQSLMRISY